MNDKNTGRRRNVVQVFSSLEPGGAEVRTLELFELLHQSDAEVAQVVFQTGHRGSLTTAFEACGTTVITERFRSIPFWRRMFRELTSPEAAALHVHVKRGNALSAIFLPIARWCGVPVRIAHFRSDGTHVAGGRARALAERIYLRLIDRHATHVIGVSPASLSLGWRGNWQDDPRCRVVLSGVRLDRLTASRPSGRLHQELGLPRDAVIVVHVGRGVSLKNRGRAIRILAEMSDPNRRQLPHLVFVGRPGPDGEGQDRDMAAALGVTAQVHFLGQRSDVADVMADADVLLMTSSQEGLPGVLVEALAVGTPCVASDLPGTRFVSELLPEVTLESLDSDDSQWVRALEGAVARWRADDSERTRLQRAVLDSPFDARRAADVMTALWTGR